MRSCKRWASGYSATRRAFSSSIAAGSAGSLICRTCGTSPQCRPLQHSRSPCTRAEGLLRCHYCDFQTPIVTKCPTCGSQSVAALGIGTQRVADEVARLFPQARVLRMDSDTTTRIGDHARILSAFEIAGDVLVGTQMVAKGLDYPTVTLAAVVAADLGLNLPDFRAAEPQLCIDRASVRPQRARPPRRGDRSNILSAASGDCVRGTTRLRRIRRARTARTHRAELSTGPPARLRRHHWTRPARVISAAARYAEILRESGSPKCSGPLHIPIAASERRMALPNSVEDRDAQTVESVYSRASSLRRLAATLRLASPSTSTRKEGSHLAFWFISLLCWTSSQTWPARWWHASSLWPSADFLRAALFG